jgi:hypothetical protein
MPRPDTKQNRTDNITITPQHIAVQPADHACLSAAASHLRNLAEEPATLPVIH